MHMLNENTPTGETGMKIAFYNKIVNGKLKEEVGTDAYLNNGFQNVIDADREYDIFLRAEKAKIPYRPIGHINYD